VPLSQPTCPTKLVTVLRVLGIYSMDALNRTDWDKLGKYRARKGPDYVTKYCDEFFVGGSEDNAK
jgi:hypothetical protein